VSWLITGGCGFVGSNLADALMRDGEDVVILDDLSRTGSASNLEWLRTRHGSDWRFEQADVRDADMVSRLVSETSPTVVAHLAGQVAMTTSIADPRRDFETNALGTFNVLDALRLRSPSSILLYSSTNKVYGSLEQFTYTETATRYVLPDRPLGLDEGLPLEGHSPYGCSKLCGDQYVHDFARMYGLRTVVFRHSSMYGGRQFATYDQGWIGWFCMKALEMADPAAPPFTISGDGKQVRDALHSDDLVGAYLSATAAIGTTAGRVYNIGGGPANSLSLLELFALLERLTGSTMRFERLPWREGDQKVFVADISAAHRDFGWSPGVSSEAGIARMLDWCREMPSDGS
jgi:CDP-paratose 2-epimerase